jgi:hypothetical protein
MPTTQDTDTTVPYGYRLHQVQLSLGGHDTYYQSAQLEPYIYDLAQQMDDIRQ